MNVLASYAYLGRNAKFNTLLLEASKMGICNVMIDSGAHTIHNAKKNTGLNLDGYCSYLEQHQDYVEKYVMLDVIKNEKATKQNYETMIRRGFKPMYVLTQYDDDFKYLKDAVKNNKHLCVAGGINQKSEWIAHRYYKVYNETKALIHGLGYVKYPTMYQLPLHSVDSSSWIQAAQVFGRIIYFDNGIKTERSIDYITGKKKLTQKLIHILESVKISPKIFLNKDNHKGQHSIGTLLSVLCYLEYQKLSYRKGQRLFLAMAAVNQLKAYLYVAEHQKIGTLNYENFRKI